MTAVGYCLTSFITAFFDDSFLKKSYFHNFLEYNLSNSRNIIGDFENSPVHNTIVLLTKNVHI